MKILDTQNKVFWNLKSEAVQLPLRFASNCLIKTDLNATKIFSVKVIGRSVSGNGNFSVYLKNNDGTIAGFKSLKFSKNSTERVLDCNIDVVGSTLCIERGRGSVGTIIIERVVVFGEDISCKLGPTKKNKESFTDALLDKVEEKTRLAIVIPYSIYGGAEVYIEQMVKSGRENFDIDIICVAQNKISERLFNTPNNIIHLNSLVNLKSKINAGFYDFIVFYNSKKVYKVLSDLKEDRSIEADLIEIYHSNFRWSDSLSSLKHRKHVSKLFRVSRGLANDIEGVAEDSKVFIPVPVDSQRFYYSPTEPMRSTRKKRINIGMVARLSPEKNINYALSLAKIMPEYSFSILGSGPLLSSLTKKIRSEKINNVKFLGYKDDVERYYSEFDCLLLTSKIEGTPISIAEALMCGLPVFTTNVGEIYNLYSELDGVVFLSNELFSDASLIKEFDFEKFDSLRSHKFASNLHDLHKNRDLFFSSIIKNKVFFNKLEEEYLLNGEYL